MTTTKTINYVEFRKQNTEEFENFIKENCFWAFGEDKLNAKLKELNITREEFDKDYVGFCGGAMRRDKVVEYNKIVKRMQANMRNLIFENYEFAKSAFKYEMQNYECFISDRFDEVRSNLGLTLKDINSREQVLKAWNEAREEYWNEAIENNLY